MSEAHGAGVEAGLPPSAPETAPAAEAPPPPEQAPPPEKPSPPEKSGSRPSTFQQWRDRFLKLIGRGPKEPEADGDEASEADETDTTSAKGTDTPAAGLVAGMSFVLAALTGLATANGEVGRLFRNDEGVTVIAVLLVIVAITCGLLYRIWPNAKVLLLVGTIGLVAGLAFAMVAEIRVLGLSDRPTIALTTQPGHGTVDVTAHVVGHKAKAHDQLVVIIYGSTEDEDHQDVIFYEKTGPVTSGDLSLDASLTVDAEKYLGVYVSAVEVPERVAPATVDCNGIKVGIDGSTSTTIWPDGGTGPDAFRPNDTDPLVACAVMKFPPTP